jgi:hypothetical protein
MTASANSMPPGVSATSPPGGPGPGWLPVAQAAGSLMASYLAICWTLARWGITEGLVQLLILFVGVSIGAGGVWALGFVRTRIRSPK